MDRSSRWAIGTATGVLVFLALAAPFLGVGVAWTLFGISPFLVVWVVIRVLKDTSEPPDELKEAAEWGYADQPDLRPVW